MGLRYKGADSSTIVLRNYGTLDLPLDVNVSGASANPGMIDGMLGLMLRQQVQSKPASV